MSKNWNYLDQQDQRRRNLHRLGWAALGLLTAVLAFGAGAVVGQPEGGRAGPDLVNEGAPPFRDVTGASAVSDRIYKAWAYGYMVGTGPTTFEPTRPVTRAEAAVVMLRCLQGTGYTPAAVETPPFVEPWAAPWLVAAGDAGLMEPGAVYLGGAYLTRADLAALVSACAIGGQP